jgi:hypothetical protein
MPGRRGALTFEKLVLSSPFGRIFACNVLDMYHSAQCQDAARLKVREWISVLRALHAAQRLVDDPPGSALETYLVQCNDAKALDHLLSVKAPLDFHLILADVLPDYPVGLASVATVEVIEEIADPISRRKWIEHGVRFPRNPYGPGTAAALAKIASLGSSEREFSLGFGRELGRKTLWVTPAEPLEAAIRGAVTPAADRARDILGLVHHGKGRILVTFEFPRSVAVAVASARPSGADAGIHKRYRWQAGPAAQGPAWGGTVDLQRLFDHLPDTLGLAERAHKPVDERALASSGAKLTFTLLGRVEAPRGDIDGVRDNAFAQILQSGRSDAVLTTMLGAL